MKPESAGAITANLLVQFLYSGVEAIPALCDLYSMPVCNLHTYVYLYMYNCAPQQCWRCKVCNAGKQAAACTKHAFTLCQQYVHTLQTPGGGEKGLCGPRNDRNQMHAGVCSSTLCCTLADLVQYRETVTVAV